MKLIIGNKNYSSWSLRAWLLPAMHELPFEEIRIALSTDETAAEIEKYSAAGKVPVLHDGGLIVWDSLAVCEYISEQHLAGRGWPADVQARAEARSCSAEMHSGFFSLREQMPMNCRATNRKVAMTDDLAEEIARIDEMWTGLRVKYSADGPWLFGDFSIADCMFAPVVFRFSTYNVSVSETSEKYMQNVLASPKIQHWLEQARRERETIASEEIGM